MAFSVSNLQHCFDGAAAQQSCSEEMPFTPATLIKSSCSGSWQRPNGRCAMWMPKVSVIFGVRVGADHDRSRNHSGISDISEWKLSSNKKR